MRTDTDGLIQWIEQQETLQGLNADTYPKVLTALGHLFERTARDEAREKFLAVHMRDNKTELL